MFFFPCGDPMIICRSGRLECLSGLSARMRVGWLEWHFVLPECHPVLSECILAHQNIILVGQNGILVHQDSILISQSRAQASHGVVVGAKNGDSS